MKTNGRINRFLLMTALLGAAVAVPWLLRQSTSSDSTLVVYCAHDSIFADAIIRHFQDQSGIKVDVRYDEEANKSLGLTNLLIAEKDNPRCDVFWNNQTLGTMRLQKEGVLSPCDPKLFARIPAAFKDPEHHWAGFAARLRVYIVNTEKMDASEQSLANALKAASLSNAAIAVPLFGTTLSHYSVLCDQMGIDALQLWHKSLHDRGIREARGNGGVKDLVAEGACDWGFTDTDDAFAAIDNGHPVTMFPVRLPSGETICLPNSVAMIRGCRHPDAAEKFIEFLLSEEVEIALAKSAARQIPLGPVDTAQLPDEVRELAEWAAAGVSLEGAMNHQDEVLQWLSKEYVGQ